MCKSWFLGIAAVEHVLDHSCQSCLLAFNPSTMLLTLTRVVPSPLCVVSSPHLLFSPHCQVRQFFCRTPTSFQFVQLSRFSASAGVEHAGNKSFSKFLCRIIYGATPRTCTLFHVLCIHYIAEPPSQST
jgi:hypothetical protein